MQRVFKHITRHGRRIKHHNKAFRGCLINDFREVVDLVLKQHHVTRVGAIKYGVDHLRGIALICPAVKQDTIFSRGVNLDYGMATGLVYLKHK